MYNIEKHQGTYYVYDEDGALVYMASNEESLKNFNGDIDTDSIKEDLKPYVSKPKYDEDVRNNELRSYYKRLTGRKDEDVLTEEMLDKEGWALRKTSALKNMSVNAIREKLLK